MIYQSETSNVRSFYINWPKERKFRNRHFCVRLITYVTAVTATLYETPRFLSSSSSAKNAVGSVSPVPAGNEFTFFFVAVHDCKYHHVIASEPGESKDIFKRHELAKMGFVLCKIGPFISVYELSGLLMNKLI